MRFGFHVNPPACPREAQSSSVELSTCAVMESTQVSVARYALKRSPFKQKVLASPLLMYSLPHCFNFHPNLKANYNHAHLEQVMRHCQPITLSVYCFGHLLRCAVILLRMNLQNIDRFLEEVYTRFICAKTMSFRLCSTLAQFSVTTTWPFQILRVS